ncbi:MAG: YafY family protein [Eubacteriales bacterium]
MKINRLFEIVYILLNSQQVTAKELAERFEVSTRTIYRDIDILSSCNVPVYCSKGKGGGIGLLESGKMDKAMLTTDEQMEILSALQGLKATDIDGHNKVLGKLSTFFNSQRADWIEIDFSSFSANSNWKDNFEIIKSGILNLKRVEIEYANMRGEISKRKIEPIKLIFKGVSWYLSAYCLNKNDYRMFKLNRIISIKMLEEVFQQHPMQPAPEGSFSPVVHKRLVFRADKSYAFRIYDDFYKDNISVDENGDFIVSTDMYERDWMLSYILSLGDRAECMEPEDMRREIGETIKKSAEKYL